MEGMEAVDYITDSTIHLLNVIYYLDSRSIYNYVWQKVYLKDCGTTKKISIALAEQILSVSKSKLHKKVGTIKGTIYEEQIKKAITVQLDL